MRRSISIRLVAVAGVAAMILAVGATAAAATGVRSAQLPATTSGCETTTKFGGTFIQPALIDGWTNIQLDDELEVLDNACIDTQILQWTADSAVHTAVFGTGMTGYTQSTSTDVVDRLLSTAESWNKSVYVGLQVNADWFTKGASDVSWLDDQATIAENLADELYADYGAYDSFAGWYLPFEMDNLNFPGSTAWTRMSDFYSEVIGHLHALAPDLPVVVAPFYNSGLSGAQTPSQWQTMWESILANSAIDIIALQDGVGAGHATVSDLASWFSATRDAIDTARPSTLLYDDAETYTFGLQGLQPMPVSGFVADMNTVAPYVDDFWAFAYDHYQSPQSVVSPYYDATYQDFIFTGSVESCAPGAPSSLTATVVDSQTISLSWTTPSDNIGVAGYDIYRGGDLIAVKQGAAGWFTDGQLDGSTSYSYTVKAFDGAGNLSSLSSSASATTSAAPSYSNTWSSGRSYTSTVAANASYPDTGGTELTDGVHGAVAYGTAWQGRNAPGTYSFTIDLGSNRSIGSIESSWLQVRGDYVFLPPSITMATSTNGTTFTTVGTITTPAVTATNQIKSSRLLGLSSTVRYVKVTIDGGSAWTMLDEIEVKG